MPMSTLDESSVVVAANHQTSTEVEGEKIILDLDESIYFGLNPTGAQIWEAIQEPTPIGEVATKIAAEYDVDTEQCLEDVMALVQDLKENGLVDIKN
jgi:hypothetical protein